SANIAAATIPGSSAGNVISRNASHSVAPRSIAASSRAPSNVRSLAATTITTYAIENATCARITVCNPSRKCKYRNTHWKNASSETPVTISGVTSDRYSAPDISRSLRFQNPYAHAVPTMVERIVETSAISMLLTVASARFGSANTALYQRSENPCHTVNRDELKLKS